MHLLQRIKEIDIKTSHFFPQFYHHRILSEIMKFIAGIGDFGMVWLVLVLVLSLSHKTQLLSQKMLMALLLATIVGQVTIKSIVKRKRPCHTFHDVEMLIPVPSDYSFPSGHTMSSFACATTVCFFFPKIGIICILFAFLMAFSRLYLFVHYLSDVSCAIILGIIVGIVVMLF